ncbi:MAG: acetate kinase [Candidatus Nomurabacteria bacterium]|nr:acetate kinase [Candidatus Nomurabacteria bacterium]
MSNILVINSGSSTVKFQLIDEASEEAILSGKAEGLRLDSARIEIKFEGQKIEQKLPGADHEKALDTLFEFLDEKALTATISAVGHRVAHGGELFRESVLITPDVLDKIRTLTPLAPLHNPANILGIEAITKINPKLPQVAVFDTAFHSTMPPEAYRYAVPDEWYKKYGVRRYGFHGTSYRFIVQKIAKILGKKPAELNLIVAHVGSGASISAIRGGKSVSNSMGFTPLAGLPMGTRSGNIDPGIIPYIMEREHLSAEEVISKLNKESGHQAMSKVSDDMRDVVAAAEDGNAEAELSIKIFARKIAKYIAGFMPDLPSLDALIFTAGIGENGFETREAVVERLAILGFKLDPKLNAETRVFLGKEGLISAKNSKYPIYALGTNEELMIAKDTKEIVKNI